MQKPHGIMIIVNEREVMIMTTIYGSIYGNTNSKEKWFVIMKDNSVMIFESLLKYAYWHEEASEEEKNHIDKIYTNLNEKDRVKLKELNLI